MFASFSVVLWDSVVALFRSASRRTPANVFEIVKAQLAASVWVSIRLVKWGTRIVLKAMYMKSMSPSLAVSRTEPGGFRTPSPVEARAIPCTTRQDEAPARSAGY